jgi:hypothetical protein
MLRSVAVIDPDSRFFLSAVTCHRFLSHFALFGVNRPYGSNGQHRICELKRKPIDGFYVMRKDKGKRKR